MRQGFGRTILKIVLMKCQPPIGAGFESHKRATARTLVLWTNQLLTFYHPYHITPSAMASKKAGSKNLYGMRKKRQKENSPSLGTQPRKKKSRLTTQNLETSASSATSQWPGTMLQPSNPLTAAQTQAQQQPALLAYGPPGGMGQGAPLPPWTPSMRPGEEMPQEMCRVTGSYTTGAI